MESNSIKPINFISKGGFTSSLLKEENYNVILLDMNALFSGIIQKGDE